MSENIYPKVSAFEASGYGVSASPKFPKLEEAVLDYWKKDGTFQASIDNREAGPHGDNEFVFYDGPPFANGLPHYGHLLTGYAKDLVARYQTQRGHKVERRFGWDTHGLPAELEAMKQLGMTDKQEILEMGIDNFNDAARAPCSNTPTNGNNTLPGRRVGWTSRTTIRPSTLSTWNP